MQLQARFATVVWMLVAWTQLIALSNASEPIGSASNAAVRESLKFNPEDRVVLIPVRVGAQDYQFILDTGATVSAIDASLRSRLGPRVDSVRVRTSIGDDMKCELYSPPDARVGSLPLTKGPVLCRDFISIREASGYSVYGFVGMDFLKDWIITLDFDEGRLDILPPGIERDPKWGESIPFVYDTAGGMRILVTVGENVRTPFMIDTGNRGTGDLEEALLNRFVASREARVTGDEESLSLSGKHSSRVARLSHLSLGSFRHENLRFASGKQNVLGLNYVSRYQVTIDFPNERLCLAKGKRFAGPDRGQTCGLRPLFRAGGIEVESVDKKGPAHAAGVRAKDVIVKFYGKSVSEWKPSEVDRLLTTEGKSVQMTIERGGKRMEMSFTPKEYD